jgi:hypothetical protein
MMRLCADCVRGAQARLAAARLQSKPTSRTPHAHIRGNTRRTLDLVLMGGNPVSLEPRIGSNSLQKRQIRGDHGPSRNPRILDRTQEVAGSSPASSIGFERAPLSMTTVGTSEPSSSYCGFVSRPKRGQCG